MSVLRFLVIFDVLAFGWLAIGVALVAVAIAFDELRKFLAGWSAGNEVPLTEMGQTCVGPHDSGAFHKIPKPETLKSERDPSGEFPFPESKIRGGVCL